MQEKEVQESYKVQQSRGMGGLSSATEGNAKKCHIAYHDAVVKVDRRIRWHYTTTILRFRIGARLTRYRNCKFHNFARTISRHADGISRYSVPPSAGPLLPLVLDIAAYPDISPITVHEAGLQKLLCGLKVHKASGPNQVVHDCSRKGVVAPAMTLVFQSALHQGAVSSDWSYALVMPLLKKGNRSKASNY